MTRKKKIIILSVSSIVLAFTTVFLSLGLTIWRAKTAEEWLADFTNCLQINRNESDQKIEKFIYITENGTDVAKYRQVIEIHNQDGQAVGHIVAEEKYLNLGTTDFDTYDEYFFYDGTMYMSRRSGEQTTKTEFASSWDVFWEVGEENIGKNNFTVNKDCFLSFQIEHENELHRLSAQINDDKKEIFFGGAQESSEITEIILSMTMDETLRLAGFNLEYKFKSQRVKIEMKKSDSQVIEMIK